MKRHHTEHDHAHPEGENHFWISISDLMTSVLFVFILILAYNILKNLEKQAQLDQNIQRFKENVEARTELLKQLKETLNKENVLVEIDIDKGKMRLQTEGLFDDGSADVKSEESHQLQKIAIKIQEYMREKRYYEAIDTVFIEGHTDNKPMNKICSCPHGSKLQLTNMELSTQRAINTYLYMNQSTNGELEQMKNVRGQYLFSYSGYAETRPIDPDADNNITENRSRNRRIEFFFAINPPDLEKAEKAMQESRL